MPAASSARRIAFDNGAINSLSHIRAASLVRIDMLLAPLVAAEHRLFDSGVQTFPTRI